jgi:hypothetical protein
MIGFLDDWINGKTPRALAINPTIHQSINPAQSYEQDN